jgi:hypothetical protein
MREPCRILVYVNTQYEYGQRRRRTVKRAVRQVEPHPDYRGVEVGEIRVERRRIQVYRLTGDTAWTSFVEEVSRFSYLLEAEEVSIEPEEDESRPH